MFGLTALFNALARLTTAITHSAELFETTNKHLAERLGIDHAETAPAPELDHHQPVAVGNGRRRK